jgi:hypothetical protein
VYNQEGRHAEALEIFERALAMEQQELGQGPPDG